MKRIITLLVVLAATSASAEPVVVAIEGKDIYIDLGAKDGVGAGSELELLHEVVARDPKSGSTLRDRFSLGTLTVIKSGAGVSVARADDALARRVLVGDQVRLASAKRTFVDPWAERVVASKGEPMALPAAAPVPGAPAIDHVALVREAWQDTLGQPYDQRVARWTQLLKTDPQSPYRKAVETEIKSLEAQTRAREAALEKARSVVPSARSPRIAELVAQLNVPAEDRSQSLLVGAIERAVPGKPIELAFLASNPASIRGAWLYVRPDGAPGYTRIQLRRDGDAYLRATIDAALVKGAKVEWYVETKGAGEDADVSPVVGSQQAPRIIQVDDIVDEEPIARGRTHIDGHIDYVDFDGGFNKGYDQYTQAELDFTYRFRAGLRGSDRRRNAQRHRWPEGRDRRVGGAARAWTSRARTARARASRTSTRRSSCACDRTSR